MRPLAYPTFRPYACSSCRRGLRYGQSPFTSQSVQLPDIYDVVCVGGGPAGLGLLAALRASPVTSNLRVALIESQDLRKTHSWAPTPSQFSNRCSSITPSSISFLQKIGAWQHVDASRIQPYQEMHVWDGQTGSRISFDWSMESSPFEDLRTVAVMTENANLARALLLRIKDLGDEGLTIFSGTTVTSIESGVDHVDGPNLLTWPVLSLLPSAAADPQLPRQIAARLLIGADGINSPVRTFASIVADGWDYHRHGVVATLSLSAAENASSSALKKTAYQRFLPSLGGPIALLPLPNNHASLVWSTTIENAVYLKLLPPKAFTAMVNAAFRLSMADLNYMFSISPSTLSSTSSSLSTQHEDELSWRLQHTPQPPQVPPLIAGVQEHSVASFPLRYRHASSYISPRVALVGDAAHAIHPLAGQGLNLGLGDIASLSSVIEYAVSHGMDIGDFLSLERYTSERYAVNTKVGAVCDLLHRIFNIRGQGPIAWARSLGFDIIDKAPFAKPFIMRQAEG